MYDGPVLTGRAPLDVNRSAGLAARLILVFPSQLVESV
jgi:hypothetical protein